MGSDVCRLFLRAALALAFALGPCEGDGLRVLSVSVGESMSDPGGASGSAAGAGTMSGGSGGVFYADGLPFLHHRVTASMAPLGGTPALAMRVGEMLRHARELTAASTPPAATPSPISATARGRAARVGGGFSGGGDGGHGLPPETVLNTHHIPFTHADGTRDEEVRTRPRRATTRAHGAREKEITRHTWRATT